MDDEVTVNLEAASQSALSATQARARFMMVTPEKKPRAPADLTSPAHAAPTPTHADITLIVHILRWGCLHENKHRDV